MVRLAILVSITLFNTVLQLQQFEYEEPKVEIKQRAEVETETEEQEVVTEYEETEYEYIEQLGEEKPLSTTIYYDNGLVEVINYIYD